MLLRLEGDIGEQVEPLRHVCGPARDLATEQRDEVVIGPCRERGAVTHRAEVLDGAVDHPVAQPPHLVWPEVEDVGGYVESRARGAGGVHVVALRRC